MKKNRRSLSPCGAGVRMLSAAVPFSALVPGFVLLLSGLVIGWGADQFRISALFLLAEPLFHVGVVLAAYASWYQGRRLRALSIFVGAILAFVAVRLPYRLAPLPMDIAAPSWAGRLERCVPAAPWPADGVRILQWTLTGGESQEEILEVSTVLRPDLLLLSGGHDLDLAILLQNELGGEYQIDQPEGGFPGRTILSRGPFHVCGEEEAWRMGSAHLAFAGITPDTVLPVAALWPPGPERDPDWGKGRRRWEAELSLLRGLASPALVVLADAPVLPTWRELEASFASLRLFSVPVPPNWPRGLGPLPLLPLHPYDRLWTGPGWQVTAVHRVNVRAGLRAPILTALEPAAQTATR